MTAIPAPALTGTLGRWVTSSFLTSDSISRNSLILKIVGIQKALHRPFRSDVWILSQTVVCFSLWSDRFCASVPVASEREPRSRSGQRMSECVLRRRSQGLAWHSHNSVRVCPCGEESRPAQQRSVPFGCGPDSSGGRVFNRMRRCCTQQNAI